MEPRIQYVKTSDGVNIAYAVVGSGPPLVFAATIWGTLHMAQAGIDSGGYWTIEELLATGRTIVLYDARGSGSSDRAASDYSLDARVRDVQAVVLNVGLERFPLSGFGHGATTAIAYTVAYPEAVERLILTNPFTSGAEYYETVPPMRALKAMQGMAEDEFEYLTHSLATGVVGFDDIDRANKLATAFQSGMKPNDMLRFRAAAEAIDIGDLLPRVTVPTVVIRDDSVRIGNELARGVATGIPRAQFITTSNYKLTVHDLLDTAPAERPSGTAVILFADIADSTALTERLGDTAFRDKARDLDGALRSIIRENSGTPIEGKLLGDGVLAVFTSARQAIEAALACGRSGDDAGLPLHLGLHAGDVIREENNVYGGAVNIASRISGLSSPGEVLVSETVRSLARTSAGVSFEDRGEQSLKGIADPVRVWAVVKAE
jgi:class 3 adenylate cyclase